MIKKLYALATRIVTFLGFPITGIILHGSRRVRVLIIAKEHVLLQRTSVGTQQWSLPGGGVEKHETDKQAVIREVAEEVGLKVEEDQMTVLGEDYRVVSGRRNWPKFTRVYCVASMPKIVEPTIVRPLEILEAKWFPLSDLPANHENTVNVALELFAQRNSRH